MQKRAAEWWLPGVDYTRVYHTRTIAAMAIYTVLLNVLQCATDVHGATRQQLAPGDHQDSSTKKRECTQP